VEKEAGSISIPSKLFAASRDDQGAHFDPPEPKTSVSNMRGIIAVIGTPSSHNKMPRMGYRFSSFIFA
jgi:hypothetical protein